MSNEELYQQILLGWHLSFAVAPVQCSAGHTSDDNVQDMKMRVQTDELQDNPAPHLVIEMTSFTVES